jgi:hypothetical protein
MSSRGAVPIRAGAPHLLNSKAEYTYAIDLLPPTNRCLQEERCTYTSVRRRSEVIATYEPMMPPFLRVITKVQSRGTVTPSGIAGKLVNERQIASVPKYSCVLPGANEYLGSASKKVAGEHVVWFVISPEPAGSRRSRFNNSDSKPRKRLFYLIQTIGQYTMTTFG